MQPTSTRRSAREASRSRLRGNQLTFDGLVIDLDTREVLVRSAPIETTAKEFDLLVYLAEAPRQVFTRQH